MFCGLRRDKTFHGERNDSGSQKNSMWVQGHKLHMNFLMAQAQKFFRPCCRDSNINDSHCFAEIDRAGPITCSIMDVTTTEGEW